MEVYNNYASSPTQSQQILVKNPEPNTHVTYIMTHGHTDYRYNSKDLQPLHSHVNSLTSLEQQV